MADPAPEADAARRGENLPLTRLIVWADVLAESRTLGLQLEGFTGSFDTVGCDASVRTAGLATWAAVRGDGRAVCGVYAANATSTAAAEIRAIRGALEHNPADEVHIVTDSAGAIDFITWTLEGRIPQDYRSPVVLHRVHLTDLKDLIPVGGMRLEGVHGNRRGSTHKNCAPGHPLLRSAHQLAWTFGRLIHDGFPVDLAAVALLRSAAQYGRSPRKINAWRSYRAWAQAQLEVSALAETQPTGSGRTRPVYRTPDSPSLGHGSARRTSRSPGPLVRR